MENMSVAAWNNEIFKVIVNRWGKVLAIDKDTSKRNQFDVVHVLKKVKFRSIFPQILAYSPMVAEAVTDDKMFTERLDGGSQWKMNSHDMTRSQLDVSQSG
ncbi:hypothetical protein V6N13_089105 [Hibiscus sabdariffa]|uniref:Uncharacterized protein n=1 Tax=Hibiscus sabdariffa TaxID=183260 RepID=A0ABR2ACC0_9ROSI